MLQTFDAPAGESSCVRRARSNTPLQALTTLNEPLFLEAAQALARKTLAEGGATDRARLDYAARRVLSRVPTGEEAKILLALLEKERQRFASGPFDPKAFSGTTAADAAPWTAVARVLLNLDEAARELGVSKMTVLRMIERHILAARQVCKGTPWVIRLADLKDPAVARAAAGISDRAVTPDPNQEGFNFQ